MFSIEIPFGQTASHSRKLEQLPKSSASIRSTIATARRSFSGAPWGRMLRWPTFALVKSWAAPFGHWATQAPQPMQLAASNASSAVGLGTGMMFASGALPVPTET